MQYDIVILTQSKYISPQNEDWYTKQVLEEDNLVLNALTSKGLKAVKKDWADKNFDWSNTKTILFRTTWDYFDRFQEFNNWLNKVQTKTTLINSYELIKWNLDKKYLIDLESVGIPIVQTKIIKKGNIQELTDIYQSLNWPKIILKPTISGAGRHTYLIDEDNIKNYTKVFRQLISEEDMMVQPFIENITTHGEVSHIVIGGVYSHAVLKLAKEGDFRVQDDFGGSVHLYAPSQEEKELAIEIVNACPAPPTYARIDLMWNDDMNPVVGEVELIEPELWFRNYPKAATQLAEYVKERYF